MENTKICITTKEGNAISIDDMLEAYELLEEFYNKFPFINLMDKINYYYKVQRLINKTNNGLVENKKQFVTSLLDSLKENEHSEIIDKFSFL